MPESDVMSLENSAVPAGKDRRSGNLSASRDGVTLLEMLVVVTIVGIVASLSFPALTAGLAGVRLSSASGDVASFLTSSMNNVERREQAAAIVITPKENKLEVFNAASGEKPARTWQPPASITVEGDDPHRYLLFPGGSFPRILVTLRNEKGARRSIEIDPVTAVPQVRRLEDAPR
jgi:prepilin-type N-terminal cleavage/methylation domain-containing protein